MVQKMYGSFTNFLSGYATFLPQKFEGLFMKSFLFVLSWHEGQNYKMNLQHKLYIECTLVSWVQMVSLGLVDLFLDIAIPKHAQVSVEG